MPPAMPNVDGATVTATGASDAVTVRVDQGAPAVVHVHDARGIGGLTLTAASTVTTPTHVRLYLAGLEGVEIRFADVVITGRGSQSGQVESAVHVDAGRADEPTITAHAADGADARAVPLVDGYFEINLPAAYFNTGDQSVTLTWVDFYR